MTIVPVVIDEALKEAMARMKLAPKDKYGMSDSGLGDGFHKRPANTPKINKSKSMADPRSAELTANSEDLLIRPYASKRHSEGLLFTATKTQGASVPTAMSKRGKGTVVPVLVPSQPADLRVPSWEQHIEEKSGDIHFHNTGTHETTWQHPTNKLAGGWSQQIDPETGKTFYYNPTTNETSWELPDLCKNQEAERRADFVLQGNSTHLGGIVAWITGESCLRCV